MLYTHLPYHNDSIIKTHAERHVKENVGSFFTTYLTLTLLQGFERLACERMLETERKLHILTPLLWPSRCVLFSWCWGPLHWGFPRAPSVGCGFPYHISSLTLWESAGNCIGGFRGPPRSGVTFPTTSRLQPSGSLLATASGVSEVPLGRMWPSLPHLVSNPLGVCWQLPLHPKLNWVK